EGSLMYLTRASSYKSGGLNPPAFTGAFAQTFGPEYVESFEWGFKNSIGGKANFNLTFFQYDYEGLQISKIVDRTSVNENIDAVNSGIELEFVWAPSRQWRFDFLASRLNTEIQGGNSINPADSANAYTDGDPSDAVFLNRKNGDTSFFLVENPNYMVNGSPYLFQSSDCGQNFEGGTLQCSQVFANDIETTFFAACETELGTGNCGDGTGMDVRTWLAGLDLADVRAAEASLGESAYRTVPIGIAVDLTGNQLPNAPEQSARLGMQYIINLDNANLSLRADYYWQSDFYYRVFNTQQDLIESWDVINLQASLSNFAGDWTMEFWVKNFEDKDFITGGYFTDASSGNFTNLFLLEPRTVGISFRFRH
ncbi:MAG: TonB-dependent receptor domain-containing protein, partial [Gammaproteobacteria bacterium]